MLFFCRRLFDFFILFRIIIKAVVLTMVKMESSIKNIIVRLIFVVVVVDVDDILFVMLKIASIQKFMQEVF